MGGLLAAAGNPRQRKSCLKHERREREVKAAVQTPAAVLWICRPRLALPNPSPHQDGMESASVCAAAVRSQQPQAPAGTLAPGSGFEMRLPGRGREPQHGTIGIAGVPDADHAVSEGYDLDAHFW